LSVGGYTKTKMDDIDSTMAPSALSKPILRTFDFSQFGTFSGKGGQRNAHLSFCGNMSQNVAPWCPAGTRWKEGSHSSASFNLGFGDSVARPEELNCSGVGRVTRARGGKYHTGRVVSPARVTANPLFSRAVPPARAPCYSAGAAHRYLSCVLLQQQLACDQNGWDEGKGFGFRASKEPQ
jgi:hypothetical protein